jgi:DNA-binding transcriptional LysR family regulator
LTTPDHPLAALKKVSVEDILGCDVIGLTEGSAISIALGRLANQVDRPLHMRIRVGSFDSMTAMVAAGVGIGVMPSGVARALATGKRFRILPIDDGNNVEGIWPTRQFLLCHPPAGDISSSTVSILDVLSPPM